MYYRSPSTGGDYLEALSESLSIISQHRIGSVMLLGDFNAPGIDWDKCVPPTTSPVVFHRLCEIIQYHSLEQMIRKPTRFDAILDLVLTNSPHSVSNLNSGPGLSTSDHNAVEFIVSCQQHRKVQHAKVIYNYNQADFDVFREALGRIPWETVFLSIYDIDEVWGKWISLFKMSVQAVIPTKRLKRRNRLPWMNGEIRKQIRSKRHLWKVAKHNGSPLAWSKYKKLRNWLKSEISRSRSEHITRMATQSRSNPKRFWSFMNSVLRKQGMPGLLKTPSGTSVCSSTEKADAFNTL